jgi:hypothetical protein
MPARQAPAGFSLHRISGVAHVPWAFDSYLFSSGQSEAIPPSNAGGDGCLAVRWIGRLDRRAGGPVLVPALSAIFPGAPRATQPGTNTSASIWGAPIAAAFLK